MATIQTTGLERLLGKIPPNYDQYLVIFWEFYNYEENKVETSIVVSEPYKWTKQSIVEENRLYYETPNYRLVDWKLLGHINNAPSHVFVPKGMELIIDAVYLSKEKYWVNKPIKFVGNDYAVSVDNLIQAHNHGDDYFYIGFDLNSPVIDYSSAWCNDNF